MGAIERQNAVAGQVPALDERMLVILAGALAALALWSLGQRA